MGSGDGQAKGIPSISALRGASSAMYLARLRLSGPKNAASRTASGKTGLKRTVTENFFSSACAPGIARYEYGLRKDQNRSTKLSTKRSCINIFNTEYPDSRHTPRQKWFLLHRYRVI